MPVAGSGGLAIFDVVTPHLGIKAFLILFLIFYAFFAVILYRQVQIMNRKLPTSLSPLLRFLGVVNIGVTVAVLFLVIGNF